MQSQRHRALVRMVGGLFAGALALVLGAWAFASLASSASLSASPANPLQNDTVTLTGSGFMPGEDVAIWITYPDFRVYGVAQVGTDGSGTFNYPYLPDFLGATFTPTGKYTYTARGLASGYEVYADINVAIGAAPAPSSGVSLKTEPGKDGQGSYFVFRGSGYGTSETVALWLRYPDNHVEDLGQIRASGGGFAYVIYVSGSPVGHYALTARGLTSDANGIAEFDVTVDDLTVATGPASLKVSPSPDTQRSFALFEGGGFQPSEIVTVWVTLPDYSTLWVGDVQADAAGSFAAVLYLSEQEPVGKRTFTAYGNRSGKRATADYTLQPGSSAQGYDVPAHPAPDASCSGAGCF